MKIIKSLILSISILLTSPNVQAHKTALIACKTFTIAVCVSTTENLKKEDCIAEQSFKNQLYGDVYLTEFNKKIPVKDKSSFFETCSLYPISKQKDGEGIYLACSSVQDDRNKVKTAVYNFGLKDNFALVKNSGQYLEEVVCKNAESQKKNQK